MQQENGTKTIRRATQDDLSAILSLYDRARAFMRQAGNLTQWTGGYPSREVILADMDKGCLYLCEETADENGPPLAVFYCAREDDPTYRVIYDGAWQNDRPYAVIHRIAVSDAARGRGVAGFIFDACFAKYGNLKIDTHRDNLPMQRALEKNGFRRCGIIHLLNGDERVAYQRG